MKTKILALLLTVTLLFALVSCAAPAENPQDTALNETTAEKNTASEAETEAEKKTAAESDSGVPAEGLWKDATYREDKTFGTGAKSIKVTVKAENASVTFTVNIILPE